MKLRRKILLGVAVTWAYSAPSLAADIVVGTNNGGNCYPFSCFAGDGGVIYQQVYTSSAFTQPTTINQLSFFRLHGGAMDTASYNIAFYLTSKGPGTLSSTRADNLGALLTNFGDFAISGLMPETLNLSGNSFVYDPTAGNLLMEVSVLAPIANTNYSSFFQADGTSNTTARFFAFNTTTGSTGTGALVTGFSNTSAVPEPASWAMMILGFGVVGAAARLRRGRAGALAVS